MWFVFFWLLGMFLWCLPELTLGGLVVLVFHYQRDVGINVPEFSREWYLKWLRRGIVIPMLLWMLACAGHRPFMPPMAEFVAHLTAIGHGFAAWWLQTGIAAVALGTFWTALSFIWFLVGLFRRAKNNDDLLLVAILSAPLAGLILFWPLIAFFGWAGLGAAIFLWTWPLTHYCLSTGHFKEPAPMYSRAIAKIKFGKYAEAEMAIIGELEKCETDFDGWLMLAELYARQFHDLAEAEKTIYDLCAEPATTLSQISIALHKLADWYLEFRSNPAAARRVLEDLRARMPGTHLELMARNRIHSLPASTRELEELRTPRRVAIPVFNEGLDESSEPITPKLSPQDAIAAANQCVEKLKQNPNDTASREKLARIFAEEMRRLDLALEQIELLVNMQEPEPAKKAHWLTQAAAWQIRIGGNESAARELLEKLVEDYSQYPQAFAAQRRLTAMKAEERIRAKGTPIKPVLRIDPNKSGGLQNS